MPAACIEGHTMLATGLSQALGRACWGGIFVVWACCYCALGQVSSTAGSFTELSSAHPRLKWRYDSPLALLAA